MATEYATDYSFDLPDDGTILVDECDILGELREGGFIEDEQDVSDHESTRAEYNEVSYKIILFAEELQHFLETNPPTESLQLKLRDLLSKSPYVKIGDYLCEIEICSHIRETSAKIAREFDTLRRKFADYSVHRLQANGAITIIAPPPSSGAISIFADMASEHPDIIGCWQNLIIATEECVAFVREIAALQPICGLTPEFISHIDDSFASISAVDRTPLLEKKMMPNGEIDKLFQRMIAAENQTKQDIIICIKEALHIEIAIAKIAKKIEKQFTILASILAQIADSIDCVTAAME
ncbi:MAG: hypothetical protein M0R33_14060 [Methylomonas sp.]|jgi:hypothetical protein|uniref:hypothetical protein n=1 Tax=Methylomonas sp. TaxID=418 RepID=UPI0025DF4612|nr:hypothetical protein [Methylomonas sp.]MCK9607561.1 hypothetical protein [Methylomonas sp.]